jgi:hypothetical protein
VLPKLTAPATLTMFLILFVCCQIAIMQPLFGAAAL